MKTQDCVVVLLASLVGAVGCGASPDHEVNDGAMSAQAGADGTLEGARKGTAKSAVMINCSSEDARFLNNLAFYAATATVEAHGNYDYDGSELALRYFGEGHNRDSVLRVLENMIKVARSPQLTFICESNDPEFGEEHCANSSAVLWTLDTAWQTGDWTIHVCGDRLWESHWERGDDSGDDASQVGIMVHELAHLGGAWMENGSTYGEDFALDLAASAPYFTPFYAEPFRFYVMKQNR